MKEETYEERTSQVETYIKLGEKTVTLRTIRNIILGFSLLVLGMGIGYQYQDVTRAFSGPLATNSGKAPTNLKRSDLDFTMFWEVWDTLQSSYLEPGDIDSQAMVYGAIQGMTAALGDPYTVFLPPDDNSRAKEDLNGAFDGVGIQLGYKLDTLAVMSPLDDHPAIKAGVKAGDLILHIKDEKAGIDEDTVGMTLQEAVNLIRGEKGTSVTLSLYREGKGTFDVDITRDSIVIPSVEAKRGNWQDKEFVESDSGEVVWIKVRTFGDRTQEQWDDAVRLVTDNQNEVKGIVLDLRNNPGGYLKSAIDLASDFIPEGLVVEQKGRNSSEKFEVSRRGRLLGVPVVVLINEGSASASEILAGALRDRIQATLIGEKSFGKGTVQEAADLKNKAGLHVTTAKWLLPSGEWIHKTGLKPEIEVSLPEIDAASESADLVDTQLQRATEELLKRTQ
jgi:carboxyl-terminal processing protease